MRYHTLCNRQLTKLRSAASIPLLILTISLLSLFSMTAITVTPAHAVTGLEVITTDQLEYMIGDTAALSGTNFDPNAVITLDVVRVDGIIDTGVITSDGTGSFVYNYYLNPNAIPDPELAYFGTLTVNAKDVNTTLLATTTFLDNPNYLLQGCSRFKGDCNDYLSGAWANGPNPMDGWTTGNVKGWYEQEYVPYRLRINLRKSSDAGNYFIMNEHDHLRTGVYGIDALGDYYIGAGPDSVYPEGTLTKNCTVRAAGTGILVPTTGTPCYVSGPIYSGTDDDGDSSIDEEAVDGIDNDYDGLIDEDCQSGSSPAKKIQFVTAVKFVSSEAGSSNKRWALYWKAHLATGSSGFSGSSLHAKTTATGSQDVPISDVQAPAAADLNIAKTDSPDPVSAGGTITYTITVTNNGPDSADNVQVIDTLPSGAYPVTFVSAIGNDWTCTHNAGIVTCDYDSNSCSQTIPPIYITVTAPSPSTQINITNTATVSGTPNDPNTGNNTATAVTTVNAVPIPVTDLSITKSDAPDPVNASGVLVYTLVVTNGGPNSASGVTVTDTLPAGVTFVSATGSGWSCGHSSGIITCTKSGNLSNGATATITITVTAPAEGAVISNTATVTGSQNDPNNANNSTTITTTVSSVADLSITKTDSPDPVDQLGQITYTITVSNAGPSAAPGVTVTDTIPLGSTYVSTLGTGWTCNHVSGVVTCTRPSLGSGATAPAITLKVMAPNTAGTISNTVTVSSTVTDPNTANNTASAATTVNAAANLSLTKTDSPDPATAGQNITYTIVATNNGPNTANNVIIYDYLPPGVIFVSATVSPAGTCSLAGSTVTCSGIGSLANGATATATVVIKSNEGGTLGNGAEVTSTTYDTNTNNNDASATTGVIASSDLSITKTDSQDPIVIGSTFSYTISVYNNGPSTATNVTVIDPLPAGAGYVSVAGTGWSCGYNSSLHKVTCSYTSLARLTAAPDITITVTAPGVGTTLSNTATVSSNINDPVSGNNSSTQTTTVTPEVNLSISQTDLSDPVSVNGTVSYTITVSNSGPNTATGVTVTNTLPAGTTFVSAGGTGWTCNESAGVVTCTTASLGITTAPVITIVVTAPAEGGTVTNSATVGADQGDPVPGDNTAVETTTITPLSDLTIAKTDSSDPVTAGANFTYTLTVTNNGPSTASTLTVSDPLPAGVAFVSASGTGWTCNNVSGTVICTRSSLAPGPAPAITITVTAPAEGGLINNTASVSAVTTDPVPGNNSAPQGTTITASANLSIAKADTPDPVTTNNSLTYTLSVNNSGPSTATGVTVTDVLPAGVTFGSAIGTGWSCGHTAGVVTCTAASLGTGAAPDIVITVTAPSSTGTITNTASITSGVSDPSPGNNNTSQTTTVNPPGMVGAELSITQTDVSDPVFSGGLLTYTITVTNNGPDTATGVQVTDSLPAGSTFVSASGTGWNCTGTGPITCSLSSSLINGSIATDITVTVNAPAGSGLITNTASVSANETDPNPSNNTAVENTQVNPAADLSVIKTDSPDPVLLVGDNLTYTITVTNNGPSTATGVTLTDTLPSEVSYVSKSTTQGTCTGTSSISCNIGTLANGASATVTIVTQTQVAQMVLNTATVSGSENDPAAGNNSATAVTNVGDLSRLINISTRGPVLTGDNVMIGGFILGGLLPKSILVRGFGPTLADFGVSGSMANPYLELYSGQTLVASNDNWQTPVTQCIAPATSCGSPQDIQATGKSACQVATTGCSQDAAILATLPPGAYTAILRGVGGGTGVGLIGVDDPDTSSQPKLVNISTRGMVLTGDSVMIGGFIIGAGNGNKPVLIRAMGPTLADFGVTGSMADPYLELYSGQTRIAVSDNWQTPITQCDAPAVSCGTPQDIQATGKASCTVASTGCSLDAAILATLPPGAYTAIVRGVNGVTGVGLVGIDELGQ